MANQKRKVSHSDFLQCYDYFRRALQNNRCLQESIHDPVRAQAEEEFSRLIRDDTDESSIEALQIWIDNWIDSSTWSRCYRSINQRKYLEKKPHQTIGLNDEAYQLLKEYANSMRATYSDAVIHLIDNGNPTSNAKQPPSSETSQINPASYSNIVRKSNIIPLFREQGLIATVADDEDSEFQEKWDWDAFYDSEPEHPQKPLNYDFKKNESYKKYRDRITPRVRIPVILTSLIFKTVL